MTIPSFGDGEALQTSRQVEKKSEILAHLALPDNAWLIAHGVAHKLHQRELELQKAQTSLPLAGETTIQRKSALKRRESSYSLPSRSSIHPSPPATNSSVPDG